MDFLFFFFKEALVRRLADTSLALKEGSEQRRRRTIAETPHPGSSRGGGGPSAVTAPRGTKGERAPPVYGLHRLTAVTPAVCRPPEGSVVSSAHTPC